MTNGSEKLAMAEAAVRKSRTEGVPVRDAIEEFDIRELDRDLNEAMAVAKARETGRPADAISAAAEPAYRVLSRGFAERGVENWGEALRLMELAERGVVRLDPALQAPASDFMRLRKAWAEADEPAVDPSFAAMGDPK